jgi:hypothetical protein
MAWRVGIDEAGYGPNLGPLVMTAVACRVRNDAADANLWRTLKAAVRRHTSKDARRLLVDDSKLVYSPARGLGTLELSVLSILHAATDRLLCSVHDLVVLLYRDHELTGERWYTGATPIPLATAAAAIVENAQRFGAVCHEADVRWSHFRSVIVCPGRVNACIERYGSKGAVLSAGLVELLGAISVLEPVEPVHITVDKHGGRNFYGAALQESFPTGWVLPIVEGMEESIYEIQGLDRPVRIALRPRADSGSFEVALASMISKYGREVLMAEFNGFWQQHVPDLAPTAGYPGDSERFFAAIRPALLRLRIAEELVWRNR